MNSSQKNQGTRGRPPLSETQVAKMREYISACALRLFQNEGFEAISMRRLAKEAGVTVMTLYKYFDSKVDILQAIWAEIFSELFDDLDQIASTETDPSTRLNAVAQHYVTYWLDNRPHYFMVFMSKGISQSDVSGFIDETATLERFQLLPKCVSEALDGNTSPEEIRLKSELLICMLNGIAHNLITISSYPWSEPEQIVSKAIEGLINGS